MSANELTRVLFVDDEPRILSGMRRQFHSMRSRWSIRVAPTGDEALKMLDEEPADVVVSDMRMPLINGAALLREVRTRWPATIRFILSGQTDQSKLLSELAPIHQFLCKPCDPDRIGRAIVRSWELACAVGHAGLRESAARCQSLPVLGENHRAVLTELEVDTPDVGTVAEIVGRDIGLTARVFQMVNSAFFGLPRRLTSVNEAVALIGMSNLKVLAQTPETFDVVADDDPCIGVIADLWSASVELGEVSAAAAAESGADSSEQDAARLAGTLALVGRAIMVRHDAQHEAARTKASAEGVPLFEAEHSAFGVSHETVGAYALGLWSFADEIVDAVAAQATAQAEPGTPGWALRLARSRFEAGLVVEKLAPPQDSGNSAQTGDAA